MIGDKGDFGLLDGVTFVGGGGGGGRWGVTGIGGGLTANFLLAIGVVEIELDLSLFEGLFKECL